MRNVLTKLAVAAAVLAGGATSANAFVIYSLRTSSTTVACDTGAAVSATNCAVGAGWIFVPGDTNQLIFAGNVGDFFVSANGTSNHPGTSLIGTTDSTALTIKAKTGTSWVGLKGLVVDFISYDYTDPTGAVKSLVGSASQNASNPGLVHAGDNVHSYFTVDSAGGKFPAPAGTQTTVDCNIVAAFSANCSAPYTVWNDPVPGYSLRSQQRFDLNYNSVINTNASLSVANIPEPMTTSLVGVALLGMALASRRRSTKKA